MFVVDPNKLKIPSAADSLPGRTQSLEVPEKHEVLSTPLKAPFPDNCTLAYFGMGCFWGAERRYWKIKGVYSTAVGYSAGHTPNPTYEEVCSGQTGHNEVVQVVYQPELVSYQRLLIEFWYSHDPTQGMRQGNDIGTQYRSGIYYVDDEQKQQALASLSEYQEALTDKGFGQITTEIEALKDFYFAEHYHQQYLAKNPMGYCGLGGTGVRLNK